MAPPKCVSQVIGPPPLPATVAHRRQRKNDNLVRRAPALGRRRPTCAVLRRPADGGGLPLTCSGQATRSGGGVASVLLLTEPTGGSGQRCPGRSQQAHWRGHFVPVPVSPLSLALSRRAASVKKDEEIWAADKIWPMLLAKRIRRSAAYIHARTCTRIESSESGAAAPKLGQDSNGHE
jgi:hypothetical protein